MKQPLFFFLTICILAGGTAQAQRKKPKYVVPNFATIKKDIKNPASPYYYPSLMDKYNDGDSYLTNEEFRYLFYGYVFQPGYNALKVSSYEKLIAPYYGNTNIKPREYDAIIDNIKKSLAESPFNLRHMSALVAMYQLKGDATLSARASFLLQGVTDAILSSGDGKTCASALYIISKKDETDLMYIFEHNILAQTLDGDCDYIETNIDYRNIKGFYFNTKIFFEAK
jgi:hypothetical protein